MPDWTKSMEQTFEYYIVDPGTWKDTKRLDTVVTSSITRDLKAATLGSANIEINNSIGECYIRIYLITVQNGLREKHPLGTYLIQTPSMSFDGRLQRGKIDAYTPLLELSENPPELGYSLLKDENIMKNAYLITRDHVRAPVIEAEAPDTLYADFVSNTDDSWLTFVKDLISNAKHELSLDEMGRILFPPKQETVSLQPVWTFNDDNSSILYPAVSVEHDIYKLPNVVEVIYSNNKDIYRARVVNDDPNSPLSTVNRGREIIHRVKNPNSLGNPTQNQIDEYASSVLKELSTLEYTITYTHGYCPVRLGDCVRLNYKRAGLVNVKAKVISQSIKCVPGVQVTEKAVFTNKLWR